MKTGGTDGFGGGGGGGGSGSLLGAGDEFSARGRWRRFRRALFAAVCVMGVVVLMILTVGDDVDQGNLKAIAALALLWTAATSFVWWRADGEGFAALLVRRTFRRAVFRAALVPVYLGFVAFWLASYAHFEGSDEFSTTNPATDAEHFQTYGDLRTWLLLAGIALGLVEPLLWRAWARSRPVRDELPRALEQKAYLDSRPRWIADKNGSARVVGAVGRPLDPVVRKRAEQPSSNPIEVRPSSSDVRAGQRRLVEGRRRAEGWWTYVALAWDGTALTVTDAWCDVQDLPLSRIDGETTHIVEIVWSGVRREGYEALDVTRSGGYDWILFLDRLGRQYARMPSLGFTSEHIARIAGAAGLRYSQYEFGEWPGRNLGRGKPGIRLFPPTHATMVLGIR